MEFLAESIGLLDTVGAGMAATTATAESRPFPAAASSDAAAPAATGDNGASVTSSLSFFFNSWGGGGGGSTFDGEGSELSRGGGGMSSGGGDTSEDGGAGRRLTQEEAHPHPTNEDTVRDNLNQGKAAARWPKSSGIADAIADDVLTKHVTQRIDARTNGDCFTGIVDAVTGDLIRGTMIYRNTGEVYDGPFIAIYDGEAGANPDDVKATKYLRHGPNATFRHSNGHEFMGSFELDRPKAGMWHGDTWTYEGPLVAIDPEKDEEGWKKDGGKGETSLDQKYETFAFATSRSFLSNGMPKVIGVSSPLPGSVMFHGNGTFTRSTPDGGELVYRGEFHHGLANGVGKEILTPSPDESGGRVVYNGEFCHGLRHGVGTLMEEYSDEDERDEENEEIYKEEGGNDDVCECDCRHEASGDEYEGDERSQPNGYGRRDGGECSQPDGQGGQDGNECSQPDGNEGQDVSQCLQTDSNVEHEGNASGTGPDYAAGGAAQISPPNMDAADTAAAAAVHTTADPALIGTCHMPHRRRQSSKRVRKQRISSGVWCAGQYEIEDCRGTVSAGSNIFIEEGTSVASTKTMAGHDEGSHDNSSGGDGTDDNISKRIDDSNCGESTSATSSALNRTTWDMLDEKWLGI